ncbi:hypothetical protein GF339_14670 [candidate division KSB3 bacterium]|uniref:Uncharacterized protein n=1 Tax=candidate division KSB3 bacterium TaxID=2044937 RepID=A0A9D5JY36_9BACT|nr:hypothetical protein [candidate division KSB3 bacterium]MBD3325826.1 hypothetical protein [candidate division KSB3 bacterium]
MPDPNLTSLAAYSRRLAEITNRPTIQHSTLAVWSVSPYTGVAEGEIIFLHGFRLRIREELDFADGVITSYGYEVYQRKERLYWYDDFPHPNDPTLASTFPHHKHVPPQIKRHRLPAPEISYTTCNVPRLIQEIEALMT